MVSVAVSQVGMTELIFVNPGVKVNGQYYCDVLLSQQMRPAIKRVAKRCLFTKQYVAYGEIGHFELRRYRPQTISAMTISATDEIGHRPHRPQPILYRPQAIYTKKCSVLATEWCNRDMDNSFSSCFF